MTIDESPVALSVDRVLLATPRSFCAGVEMAIKALAWMVRIFEPPVYCYHEIVHNRIVVDQFRRAGVIFVDKIDDAPRGAPLMLSAHGSAPEVVRAARERSRFVIDAVCPLVKKVHHEVRRRGDKGHVVVYAGHAGHDEAIGTMAVSPQAIHLVERPDDIAALDGIDGPVAFLAQTTLGLDEWQQLLDATRERFGDVWVPGHSDLCFATTNRQAAVRAISPRCDSVVVIGSANSSNTLALLKIAQEAALRRAVRVNGPEELPEDLWGTVGVTAGASAPEDVVQSVLARLAPRDGIEVIDVTTEDEYFPPPRDLRDLLRSAGAETLLDDDRAAAASDVLHALAMHRPAPNTRVSTPSAAPGASSGPGARRAVTVTEHLGAYSARVDRQIAEVVDHEIAEAWLRSAIGYHLGWLDEGFRPPQSGRQRAGGKKLRATLAVLAYRATTPAPEPATCSGNGNGTGGNDEVSRIVPFAGAIELVHNWSLVHDDIEDGDRTRRGRPALWTICGQPQAINVGDCIYALAFRCLDRLRDQGVSEPHVAELMAHLARTAVELTVGQMRDLAYETATDVDSDRYVEMIEGKTGALLRCATYGGALVASNNHVTARRLGEFGRRLGISFQIRDDILGIWGTDAETGKPTGNDIRRRKKTLPVVFALERADKPDRELLQRLYKRDDPLTPSEEHAVRQILDRCGAQEFAQNWARRQRAEAIAALAPAAETADPSLAQPHFDALRTLADFVTERTY